MLSLLVRGEQDRAPKRRPGVETKGATVRRWRQLVGATVGRMDRLPFVPNEPSQSLTGVRSI